MTAVADIARMKQSEAGGVSFLRRPGIGTPLVLLHGIGSRADSFVPLIDALPAGVDVIAWNAPGYATSRPLTAVSPAPRDYATTFANLMDALDLKRLVLCGHSLGCLFAASFAAQYPQRVAALAIMSPALGYRVAPGGALPPSVQARIDEIESLGPNVFAAKRAARLLHDPAGKPQVLAAVREAMAAVNPSGYAQAVHALGAGDLLADAARIPTPTLVAVGADDAVTPPANARSVHSAFRNAAGYHEIPNAGHALPQEDPAAVAHLLNDFMERHLG